MTTIRRVDIAFAGGVLMGLAALYVLGFVALRDSEKFVRGNDFAFIWVGPAAFVHGSTPYEPVGWNDVIASLGVEGTRKEGYVYEYPAWTTLVLAPLGALPIRVAAWIWAYGGLALAIGSMLILVREELDRVPAIGFVAGFVTVASQPAIVNFYNGQWSLVLVSATVATILGFRHRRQVLGALGLLGLALKPNLFLITFPALFRAAVARGHRRLLAVLFGAGTLSIVMSFILMPGWLGPYLRFVQNERLAYSKTTVFPPAMQVLFGDAGLVVGVIVLLALVAAALRFDPRSDASVPAWLAVGPIATPYMHAYDQLVIIAPLTVAAGALARRDVRLAYLFAVIVFVYLVIIAPLLMDKPALSLGSETLNAFIIAPLAMLVIAALWRDRRADDAARR